MEEELRRELEKHDKLFDELVDIRGPKYNPDKAYAVLDEKQLTDINVESRLKFVSSARRERLKGLSVLDQTEDIIEVSLYGKNSLQRSNPVYCSGEEAKIKVEDPGLRGAIHILEGSISVDINSSLSESRPPVIRANASEVVVKEGYEESEGLYVPTNLEEELSIEAPDLDLAVMDGSIELENTESVRKGSRKIYSKLEKNLKSNLDSEKYI